MRRFETFTLLTMVVVMSCVNGQTNNLVAVPENGSTGRFQYSFKLAHPKAQALMQDEFYWSPIEETSPFGNDDGSDAAYGFRQWRLTNKTISPVIYLDELVKSWDFPLFDYNEMDTVKIKAYIFSQATPDEAKLQQQVRMMKEAYKNSADSLMRKIDDKQLRDLVIASSKEMGGSYLLGQDNAIIGIGFAQFVLEGIINPDIKALTITAIKRELLPMLLNRYEEKYRPTRQQQLLKMLTVISRVEVLAN